MNANSSLRMVEPLAAVRKHPEAAMVGGVVSAIVLGGFAAMVGGPVAGLLMGAIGAIIGAPGGAHVEESANSEPPL